MDQNFDFDQRLAAARVIYEGTHGLTMNQLADITGFSKTILGKQSRIEGWRRQVISGVTDEAVAGVERFRVFRAQQDQLAEQAAEPLEPEPAPTQVTAGLNGEVQTLSEAKAIATAAREQLLERHAREWGVARTLSAEAVKIRNSDPMKSFERAKLAKITAETLQIVQSGERKAFGLDTAEAPGGHTVVIDRG